MKTFAAFFFLEQVPRFARRREEKLQVDAGTVAGLTRVDLSPESCLEPNEQALGDG